MYFGKTYGASFGGLIRSLTIRFHGGKTAMPLKFAVASNRTGFGSIMGE